MTRDGGRPGGGGVGEFRGRISAAVLDKNKIPAAWTDDRIEETFQDTDVLGQNVLLVIKRDNDRDLVRFLVRGCFGWLQGNELGHAFLVNPQMSGCFAVAMLARWQRTMSRWRVVHRTVLSVQHSQTRLVLWRCRTMSNGLRRRAGLYARR